MKPGVIIAIAAVLVIGAFAGGWYIGSSGDDSVAAGPADAGGPGGLSEEDRAAMENMSQEERQAFMQEQFGGEMPEGANRGPGGAASMRGGALEGDVIELDDETVTIALADGGSQIIYIDEETVIAYQEDATAAEIAEGTSVMLLGMPEADGVMTASMLIVVD